MAYSNEFKRAFVGDDLYKDPRMVKRAYQKHYNRMKKTPADIGGGLMEMPKPAQGDSEQASVYNALTQTPEARKGQASRAGAPKEDKPLERWRKGVESLLTSGNPTLVKQGESMLQSYHQKATQAPAAAKRSASAQIAMDIGLKPGTQSYINFIKQHSMKKNYAEIKSGYLTDADKDEGHFDRKANMVWVNGIPTHIKASGLTEGQQKASGYYNRMVGAADVFNELEDSGFDATTYQQKIASLIPFGFDGEFMTNEQKMYSTAAIDWARSKLRWESGATIGIEEARDEAKLYFPQPGNGPDVIALKRKLRATAERAMLQASGSIQKPPKKDEPELPPPPPGITWVEDE